MPLPRRAALLGSIALLAGCTSTSSPNITQAIADAQILVTGIDSVYRSFVVLYPSTQRATVETSLDTAKALLAKLSANADALTNAQTLEGIEAAVNVMLDVLASVPVLPPAVQAGILAARVLLPIIELTIARLR